MKLFFYFFCVLSRISINSQFNEFNRQLDGLYKKRISNCCQLSFISITFIDMYRMENAASGHRKPFLFNLFLPSSTMSHAMLMDEVSPFNFIFKFIRDRLRMDPFLFMRIEH